MKHELKWIIIETISAVIGAFLLIHLFSGCAAVPAAIPIATGLSGGGITLYKKATENSPMKAEFVLVKFEIHHDMYTVQPTATPK